MKALTGLCVLLLLASPLRAQMSRDSTMGFLLRQHRYAAGITQDSLSKLTSRTVSRTRISELERGLRPMTPAQQDSLYLALRRVLLVRLDSGAVVEFNAIARRNWSRP